MEITVSIDTIREERRFTYLIFALCRTCKNETISSPVDAPLSEEEDDEDDRLANVFGTGDISIR